jgi:hypothetical protein
MSSRNRKTKIFGYVFAVSAAALLAGAVFPYLAFGETSITTLSDEEKKAREEQQDKLDEINKKIKAYKQIVGLKQRLGVTLADQIDSLEAQANALEIEIQTNERKASALESDLKTTAEKISAKELLIGQEKQLLSELLRSYYADRSQPDLAILVGDGESLHFNRDEWMSEMGGKMRAMLQEVSALKQDLVDEHVVLSTKKAEADALHEQLSRQNDDLAATKRNKASLLATTQADEQKYQTLVAHLEAQKKELLDFSSASNFAEVSASVKDYPTPDKKYQAPTTWYFSQRDPRWASKQIGSSKSSMESYGCAVASVAMVFRKSGSSIDPGKMANQKIFDRDLIKWPGSWDPGIDLVSSVSHGNVSFASIDKQIKSGYPVIVHIRKSNGRGGHYVVITGKDSKDYVVHDPYFGPNLYLGTSRALVGKIGVNSKTSIDQMIMYQ